MQAKKKKKETGTTCCRWTLQGTLVISFYCDFVRKIKYAQRPEPQK